MPTPCTVTGTLNQLTGGLIGQGKILFQLTNIGTGNPIGVTGTSIIPQLTYSIVTAQNGTFSVSLWGNDNINPANTLYSVTFFDSLGNSMGPVLYNIIGASFNLNTALAAGTVSPPILFPGPAIVGNPTAPQTITGQSLTLTSSAPLITQGAGTHSGTETFTGSLFTKTHEGVQWVDSTLSRGGIDIGDEINKAYVALPSTGGRINVAAGTYSYTTPINFNVNGKAVYLQGMGPSSIFGGTFGATVLNFTPTSGSALTVASGSGGGIEGIQIKGPGSGAGIGLNLSFTVKQNFKDIDVSGFGVNLQLNSGANQCYLNNFYDAQIHDAVTNNLLLPTGASGTESIGFFGGIFHQTTAGFSATSIDLGTGADIQFYNVSFDQCGITIRGTNPKVFLGGCHFEDPVASTATAFITFDTSAAAANVTSVGTKWVEDFASGRTAIVQANGAAGGNFTSLGDLLHSVTNPLAAFVALGASNMTGTVIGFQSDGATVTSYCSGGTAAYVSLPTTGSVTILGSSVFSYGAGTFTAVGTPKVIASGTSTLTANAALGATTSQAAITTAATGALTTDAIEWSYATAPGAGDSLCIVSPYLTSANVNFVRANPTAAAQNVSALVINWRILR